MITVISGTNREDSKTSIVSNALLDLLKDLEQEAHFVDLAQVSIDIKQEHLYDEEKLSEALIKIQDNSIIPAEKVIYVAPEYNGSYAGFLKYFIDVISVRKYKETFNNKKCLLIGVSSGRAGNLRGLDHLTGSLNHVGSIVMPGCLPISQIGSHLTDAGALNDETINLLKEKLDQFIIF